MKRSLITPKCCMLILCLLLAGWFLASWISVGADPVQDPEDQAMAEDLSALSEWDASALLNLYASIGDWDTVRENLFLYRAVYRLKDSWSLDDHWFYSAVSQWDGEDLYAALLYAQDCAFDRERLLSFLALSETGAELDELVSGQALGEKQTFANYVPASETDILRYFDLGHTTEDILAADAAARQLDVTLWEVLQGNVAIPEQSAEVDEALSGMEPPLSITIVEPGGKKTTYKAKDWADLQKNIAGNYQKGKDKIKPDKRPSRDVSKDTYDTLTDYDLANADKLAKETGVSRDEILRMRNKDMEWKDILAACRAQKRAGVK